VTARRDDGAVSSAAIVCTAALIAVVASVSGVATQGLALPSVAIAFGVFIAIGEFARLSLPGDREAAPLGAAAALGYAMVLGFGGQDVDLRAYEVVAVAAIAMLIGVAPHVIAGRPPRVEVLARRVIAITVIACLFRNSAARDFIDAPGREEWQIALVMVALALIAGLVDVSLATAARVGVTRAPYVRSLQDEVRAQAGMGAAVGATGVLIALSGPTMGYWALPVFCVPLLLVQFSFKRYSTIRATYRQTIRSLARVTDVGGYTENGHARRVCDLSLAIGRELGLSEAQLLDLEYAALMHDIGQLSLVDPIPGGATALTAPDDQRRLAEKGAEVIRETGVLDRVADIVAKQAEPYRRPGEAMDLTLPLESRIIRAANAFDDMVGGSLDSGPRFSALERLRLAMAYDYDPRVVQSLSRIVERATPLGV
jgi:hypothetical protein